MYFWPLSVSGDVKVATTNAKSYSRGVYSRGKKLLRWNLRSNALVLSKKKHTFRTTWTIEPWTFNQQWQLICSEPKIIQYVTVTFPVTGIYPLKGFFYCARKISYEIFFSSDSNLSLAGILPVIQFFCHRKFLSVRNFFKWQEILLWTELFLLQECFQLQ